VTGDLAEPETSDLTQPCPSIVAIEVVTTTGVVTTVAVMRQGAVDCERRLSTFSVALWPDGKVG